MAVKVYALFVALVFAGVVTPIAHAQLGLNLGGLLSGLVSVTGIVPCSIGSSINVSTSNVFPNATVQLRCAGNVVGSSTTNSNGAFSIVVGLPTALLSSLLSTCNVVVTTPLVSCNVNLPATGVLTAVLNPVSNILGITNLVPGNFSFLKDILG